MQHDNDVTTRLITLVNVSATKPNKRKRISKPEDVVKEKKAKSVRWGGRKGPSGRTQANGVDAAVKGAKSESPTTATDVSANGTKNGFAEGDEVEQEDVVAVEEQKDEEDDAPNGKTDDDAFETHFGAEPVDLSPAALGAVGDKKWQRMSRKETSLGRFAVFLPEAEGLQEGEGKKEKGKAKVNEKVMRSLEEYASSIKPSGLPNLQRTLINEAGTYQDLLLSRCQIGQQEEIRSALAAHAMNHVIKTRRRVLKNNERLARLSDPISSELETRDQGFTRPKVLVLLPFRNSAIAWVNLLTRFSLCETTENRRRFEREYSLPEGAVDKLVVNKDRFPTDHVNTFAGNIDDNFRIGVKVTRQTVKLYAPFYQADVIVASPLGLRMVIEKEENADFLSSIEVLIVDQLNVMLMQNWDHVEFVFKHLNQIPKEAHDCDFSRVKQWYLDGKAANMRQTILLSPLETPEVRRLFNATLVNVAGKRRQEAAWEGVLGDVRKGIRQTFVRFDVKDPSAEADVRFQHFMNKTLPGLLKSAVSCTNTAIVIPSYFDFVRVQNYLRKMEHVKFAAISEYSSNQDISRARTAFFNGEKSFLLITERFHFYRRYRLRGIKTLVFYSPPDHAHFYSEFASMPFDRRQNDPADDEGPVDESDVSVQTVFSRFDLMRLERIVGSGDAKRMVGEERTKWTFV